MVVNPLRLMSRLINATRVKSLAYSRLLSPLVLTWVVFVFAMSAFTLMVANKFSHPSNDLSHTDEMVVVGQNPAPSFMLAEWLAYILVKANQK